MNPLDLHELKRQGYMMIDFLVDYYRNVANYPVLSQVQPGYLRELLPSSAPSKPEPFETLLKDVKDHIVPGITHWQSQNYFAHVPSSSSVAGFMGEMLSTGFGVVGFNWISSPAATETEIIVMDWLGQALKLPECFLFSSNVGGGGVMLGTTCEAILCTLVAARDDKLRHIGRENLDKLVVYGSDQAHFALQKATHIAGIHPENFRVIKTKKSSSFTMSPDSLLSAILHDLENGQVPCFLCATVGTTTTTSVDPIGPLCDVAKNYGIWVHVDAAYAGGALICPEFRHFINGVEGTNSFSFNAHQWLLTNETTCCLWVKKSSCLTNSLSTNPEYLRNKASESNQVIDYKDWQIALSRKFQSLKLWFVFRSYGLDNLRNFQRNHIKMAKTFEDLVKQDKRFEIFVPRYFSLVCFRVSPLAITNYKKPFCNGTHNNNVHDGELRGKIINDDDEHLVNEINSKLLDLVNDSGKVYMSHGKVEGAFVIRCAIGATLTEEQHVIVAWNIVKEYATSILSKLSKA
ncbi:hypothetical protein QN277_023145 [Acacia crassicarpa]|nr:hypothetical protein QN277_023145 [Acacia crassicarpa]